MDKLIERWLREKFKRGRLEDKVKGEYGQSISLSIYLSVYLSIYHSIYLNISQFIYLSNY